MKRIAACVLLSGWLAVTAAAQDSPNVARLIEELGGDDIEARDEAEAALVAAGRPAVAAVKAAMAGAAGETKSRLERVLKALVEPRWTTDLAQARATAKSTGKPLLVFSTVGPLGGYV